MMKKSVLLLIIVVSFCSLNAQDSNESSSPGGIFIGVKAGYGIVNYESIIKGEKNFADMSFNNLSYGVLAGFKLKGSISLQLEGNFAKYGARNIIPTYIYSQQSPLLADYGPNSIVDRVDMDLYTIDLPLTLKFSFSDRSFSPYIYGGVNYGINAIGRTTIIRKITYNDVIDYRKSNDDITARIIMSEISPVIGFGMKMEMVRVTFFGDLRYKHGFTNLSNVDNSLGFTNSALWVSAGIYLYL